MSRPLRFVLFGDGESPHIAKWMRALAPRTELWIASSRGLRPEVAHLVPVERQLLLHRSAAPGGGNAGLLRALPLLRKWLEAVDPDWINPHYLTSHGLLAMMAVQGWWLGQRPLRAKLLGSAWGSDILVTPQRSWIYRWATQAVLAHCTLTTSDSTSMASRMQELGARLVQVFPFGLETLPDRAPAKQPWLFYANRGLEPIYRPLDVIDLFAQVVRGRPEARLVVSNDGTLRAVMESRVVNLGLSAKVRFVGRLAPEAQNEFYGAAQWYVSVPASDAVAVSVLEAMAWGCVPLLSDLPANAELVVDGQGGLLLRRGDLIELAKMEQLLARADEIATAHRAWIAQHAMFGIAIDHLLAELQQFEGAA